MKLVAICRVRNEADIIEAFVRHHCAHFHKLIILDDGSSDGTMGLLGALQAAGLPLVVLKDEAVAYEQSRYMTRLLRIAVYQFGADWVAPLDADEFIEPQPGMTLAEALAGCGPQLLSLSWSNFLWSPDSDESSEPNPVLRLRLRLSPRSDLTKLLVPAQLVDDTTQLAQGNHELLRDGKAVPAVPLRSVSLCHFPVRDPIQYAGKIAIGYLKYAAMPQWDRQSGFHYVEPYRSLLAGGIEELTRRMHADSRRYSQKDAAGDEEALARDQPCDYRGGPVTLTSKPQTPLSNVLHYTEALATALGNSTSRHEAAAAALELARRELAMTVEASRQLEQQLSALRRKQLLNRMRRLLGRLRRRLGRAGAARAIAGYLPGRLRIK